MGGQPGEKDTVKDPLLTNPPIPQQHSSRIATSSFPDTSLKMTEHVTPIKVANQHISVFMEVPYQDT